MPEVPQGYPGFIHSGPDEATYLRSIVLFGDNTASYKFALTRALLDLAEQQRTSVTLQELAPHFAGHILNHVQTGQVQGTMRNSIFLNAAQAQVNGQLGLDDFHAITAQHAFRYVLDLYHRLPGGETSIQFYVQERKPRRLVLTDELLALTADQRGQLAQETEARWQLVEHAWTEAREGQGGERPIVFDPLSEELVLVPWRYQTRKALTKFRPALSGYQKGRCFYCFAEVDPNDGEVCHVDHVFPWSLSFRLTDTDLNGVWNLVLACAECNAGVGGKFDAIPDQRFLERLHRRNSYLIDSHHPLREALMLDTGRSAQERCAFLRRLWEQMREWQRRSWNGRPEAERLF